MTVQNLKLYMFLLPVTLDAGAGIGVHFPGPGLGFYATEDVLRSFIYTRSILILRLPNVRDATFLSQHAC